MKTWLARFLVTACLALLGLGVASAPAFADSNNCKPPDAVPDAAGGGMQGRIDDRATGDTGGTLYEQYGWSGLAWHTCDLGEDGWITMPEAAKDPGAFIDTAAGSAMMGGAGSIAAFMTQLNEWVMNPGQMLSPIDGSLVSISRAVTDSVWAPWASVIVVGAACVVAYQANQGNPRRAFRTGLAIVFAALAVVALGRTWDTPQGPKPGAVAMGQFFDSAAADVIGSVTTRMTGGSNPNIAYGATLYDHILVPLWVEGAVGPGAGSVTQQGTLAYDLYRANTLSWEEAASGKNVQQNKDAYVRIAKILDGKESGAYPANPAQYNQFRGVAGGRMGVGAEALYTMILIAIVRIPASIFLLMGLIVIRFVVMFIPIWALFAILEKTRPTAISAGKMVFAAVYNAAVFGVIGAVYTAVVSAIIMSPNPPGFTFSKVMLITALTIVIWVVSKPFRSVTVPATGDVLSNAGQSVNHGMGALRTLGSIYLGNRLANRGRGGGQDSGEVPQAQQEQGSEQREETTYAVEQVRVVPAGRRREPVEDSERRALPGPDDDGRTQLPPPQPPEPLPSPIRPGTPPRQPQLTATVPVEIDYEVIEPSRVLEVAEPQVRQPVMATAEQTPVMATVEQHPVSGEWQRREWREVWRPPSSEPQRPIWEDRARWRQPEEPWTPPSRPVPQQPWTPPPSQPIPHESSQR